MPRISVIIPTCNRPDKVVRAIRSVLAQTYADYEIIVIDDGEKSLAEDAVKRMTGADLRYRKNEPPRKGGGATRNIGIREARGEFIAFLDDDDEWLPTKLEKQMALLSAAPRDVGFCATAVLNKGENGESINRPKGDGVTEYFETTLTRFAGFLTSALLFRREVFDVVGLFDESLVSHQEAELMIRVCQKFKGIPIQEPLVHMDMSPHEHIGGNINKRIEGRIRLLEKHASLYETRHKVLAKHYFQIGLWYRDIGDAQRARQYFLLALRKRFSIRYLAHWALTFF